MQLATLVLLPGLDGTGLLFAPLLEALPHSLPVKVVSYPSSQLMGYNELVEFTVRQLPPGPIFLLGESFSGPIAVIIARRMPERVKCLTLAASFVSAPIGQYAALFLHVPGIIFVAKRLARFALLGFDQPKILSVLRMVLREMPSELIKFRAMQIFKADCAADLAQTRMPLLVLHGSKDMLVPPASIERIKGLRPDAEFRSFSAPHMLLQTKPEGCVEKIVHFLKSVEQGNP